MKTRSDEDFSLASKCMDFTMHLANQGMDFNHMDFPSAWIPEKRKRFHGFLGKRRKAQAL